MSSPRGIDGKHVPAEPGDFSTCSKLILNFASHKTTPVFVFQAKFSHAQRADCGLVVVIQIDDLKGECVAPSFGRILLCERLRPVARRIFDRRMLQYVWNASWQKRTATGGRHAQPARRILGAAFRVFDTPSASGIGGDVNDRRCWVTVAAAPSFTSCAREPGYGPY